MSVIYKQDGFVVHQYNKADRSVYYDIELLQNQTPRVHVESPFLQSLANNLVVGIETFQREINDILKALPVRIENFVMGCMGKPFSSLQEGFSEYEDRIMCSILGHKLKPQDGEQMVDYVTNNVINKLNEDDPSKSVHMYVNILIPGVTNVTLYRVLSRSRFEDRLCGNPMDRVDDMMIRRLETYLRRQMDVILKCADIARAYAKDINEKNRKYEIRCKITDLAQQHLRNLKSKISANGGIDMEGWNAEEKRFHGELDLILAKDKVEVTEYESLT